MSKPQNKPRRKARIRYRTANTDRTGKPAQRRLIRSARGEGARADALPDSADTVVRLLTDIKAGVLDARDLSPKQRRGCLVFLACGTQTSNELAVLLKVSPATIRADLRTIKAVRGREVAEWSLEQVLGQLYMYSEKCSAQAMRNEDPALAWTIQRDWAKMLRELGVVGPASDINRLTMTIEAIGDGYERARHLLARGLDPRLTGEVQTSTREVPALPLDRKFAVPQTTEADEPIRASGEPAESSSTPPEDLDPT